MNYSTSLQLLKKAWVPLGYRKCYTDPGIYWWILEVIVCVKEILDVIRWIPEVIMSATQILEVIWLGVTARDAWASIKLCTTNPGKYWF